MFKYESNETVLRRKMKLKELNEWAELHGNSVYEEYSYDDRGNCFKKRIYADSENRYFMIRFCNDRPYEKYGKNGFIRGEYDEPVEVVKKIGCLENYEIKNNHLSIYEKRILRR